MKKDGTLATSADADSVTVESSSFVDDKKVTVGHYSLLTFAS